MCRFIVITELEPGNCQNNDIRLVDSTGTSGKEGRVEVCHSGVWGSICSDEFDEGEAYILCKELGYGQAGMYNYHTPISWGVSQ